MQEMAVADLLEALGTIADLFEEAPEPASIIVDAPLGEGRIHLLQQMLLPDRRLALASGHPDTLTTLNNPAIWLVHAGCVGEAISTYEQLADDQLRCCGADHAYTITSTEGLACIRRKWGRRWACLTH